jgi:hypothetical protein
MVLSQGRGQRARLRIPGQMVDALHSQFRAGRANAACQVCVRANQERLPGTVASGFGRLIQMIRCLSDFIGRRREKMRKTGISYKSSVRGMAVRCSLGAKR